MYFLFFLYLISELFNVFCLFILSVLFCYGLFIYCCMYYVASIRALLQKSPVLSQFSLNKPGWKGTVEMIRVINIAENTMNLTPLNVKLPTTLRNSIHTNCEIVGFI